MTAPRGRAALAVLRHGGFARVSFGRFFTGLGWQMIGVAVAWQVYALTHDALALGLVGLYAFLPFLCLVLFGGHLADHVERRRLLVIAYCIEALCILALLVFSLAGGRSIWPLYCIVAVFGGTRAFWAPAMSAIVPSLVPREEFPSAAALNSLLFQIATITGPALGGVLYLLGPGVVYSVCLVLYLATVLLLATMAPQDIPAAASAAPAAAPVVAPAAVPGVPPPVPVPAAATESTARRLFEGLRFVSTHPLVLGVITLDLFAVLFGGATALLPIYAGDILHAGPAGLGLLRAMPGAGAALMGAGLALRPIHRHGGAWMFGGTALFGAATLVFGLSRSLGLSLAALFALGAGDMLSVYIRAILVQLNTPDAIRGRVSAVNVMFIGASNQLGEFESGLTARWFGAVRAVVLGALATLAVVGAWMAIFPQLRRLDRLR